MQSRMKHPVLVIPGAFQALQDLSKAASTAGLPEATVNLVLLRASQINGCGVCVVMHSRDMRKAGEADERVDAVAAWRDAPYFNDAERAALALTETVTRLGDGRDAAPDDVWAEATRHYDERELSGLLFAIASINVWNRLNTAVRAVAGSA